MADVAHHPNPPARDADIVRVEETVGCRLPAWLRERLQRENGFELDDSQGETGKKWRILPVMDRSNRKRQAATAEDIAWHTAKARTIPLFPNGAVMIARAYSPEERLVLLPSDNEPTTLGDNVYTQYAQGEFIDLHMSLEHLAPSAKTLESRGMSASELPQFRYHPDPVATGSIRPSPNACPSCHRQLGWEYTSVPYGERMYEHLCPWCIADGSAAALGLEFVDAAPLVAAGLGEAIIAEVTQRTPGFASFQQEEWQTCCSDACQFLGAFTRDQLTALPQDVRTECGLTDDVMYSVGEPARHGDLVVFGFRCTHCGAIKVWIDCS